ncbi:PTS system glucose-specific IIA component/PTS system N-acetylglucosamine-specific IIA component [Nocardiopsis mwathae]|uniref:PTS system glucose-specific IIA component/PTS system N-acetylglucosamine-specific IIA component n=1 Tax=Nocardiopsis mwathae TaxID=1472723 RepID=A0A7X0D3F8_9ACTN|nr:PTS system glucose-specific IIA component/PTS system N-acetylglucosamine-specific IIA component [Nocardiopsis mwathae]
MLSVLSPAPGAAVALSAVPDPVFAQGMVGPGVAVVPIAEPQEAVAPISGKIIKLHPHAFVVVDREGRGVLVHLGIDTVKLDGKGFEKLAAEGDEVEAGTPLIRWNPGEVAAEGLSAIVPVVALDAESEVVSDAATGDVAQGGRLFRWA